MKSLTLIILCISSFTAGSAQNLLDIYKNGPVKLTADTEYAKNNDWNTIFKEYKEEHKSYPFDYPPGSRLSLKVLPDGSVVINKGTGKTYARFNSNGSYVNDFGITGKTLKEVPSIQGYIGNTFFTKADNIGNILCFDFNGNFRKSLKVGYATNKMIGLPDQKIAIVGWVLWKDQCREFVSILDYETNQEKIIWDHFTPDKLREMYEKGQRQPFNYIYRYKDGGAIGFTSIPYARLNSGMAVPPDIQLANNTMVITIPMTGEISTYDLNGKLLKKDQINWERSYISLDEQKEIQKKAIEDYREKASDTKPARHPEYKAAITYFVRELEYDLNQIKEPIPLPYVSTILNDSDGNLLYFEFAKVQNANKFNVWVYDNGGKFVCQSSFVCDDYELELNPSKIVFHEGYIYALQNMKNVPGVPLRLVRFRLSN